MADPGTTAGEPDRAAEARADSTWARTIRATLRAAADGAWRPVARETSATPDAPALRGRTLAARLRGAGDGLDEAPGDTARYRVGAALGRGATAGVWAVFDRALRRELAAKVLDPGAGDVDAFIAEARTTASLQHPNVAPVHELDIGEDGRPYFTMYRVEGRSFGRVLADAIAGSAAPPAVNTVVSIVIAAAHALSYAHHRGVVHQDVKPDNIMLGSFGEVLLVDWGSAQRVEQRPHVICGTPLYMAPEQARREAIDARCDVYALGATLFHALYLRPPTLADDEAAFWDAKRAGAIAPPTRDERARAPAPLAAIALKALAADPAQRYQSVEALVDDLRSFQAGLAVSAERLPLAARAARWIRRHARAIAIAAPIAATIAALALLLAGQRMKQVATWGAPVFVEDCRDASLARWAVVGGSWAVVDGALVARGGGENAIVLRERFDGDLAVEYDAWTAPGARLGDLSAMWCDRVAFREDGTAWTKLDDGLQAQFGARGAMFSEIISGPRCSFSPVRPEPGRRYRVRIELRDNVMTLAIDGDEVCRLVDTLPLVAGHLALYAFYPGKCYANIRVWRRGVPELVAATAIGDSYLRDGVYERAETEYQRVIDAHPGTATASEAAFRLGLARWRDHQPEQAELAWRAIVGTPWEDEAALMRIGDAIDRLAYDEALKRIDDLAARRPALVPRLGDLWSNAVEALTDAGRYADLWALVLTPPNDGPPRARRAALLDAYLEVRERRFAASPSTETARAEALLFLERWQEVLDRCPRQQWQRCAAQCALGHPERILDDRPLNAVWSARALVDMARYDEIAALLGADCPDIGREEIVREGRGPSAKPPPRDQLMSQMDVGDFAAADDAGDMLLVRSLGLQGRAADIPRSLVERLPEATMALGLVDAALAQGEEQPTCWAWPRYLVAVRRAAAGDLAGAVPWLAVPEARAFTQKHLEPARTLVAPLIAQLAGDAGAFDRALADAIARRRWTDRQRSWFIARRLRGEIDDAAFRAQPYRLFVEADLALTAAVDADRRGDAPRARDRYRAWAAMPRWQRAEFADPVLDGFVAWRTAALASTTR